MERISKAVLHLITTNTLVLVLIVLNEKGLFLPQANLTCLFSLHYYEMPSFHWWQYLNYMFMHEGIFHLLFNMHALWAFDTPLENMWGRNEFLFFYFSYGVEAASLQTGANYYYVHQAANALTEVGISAEETIGFIHEDRYSPKWGNIISYSTCKSMYDTLMSCTVRASGAIYGILTAFAMFLPNAKLMFFFIPYPIATRYFIPIIVALGLFSGVTGTPIFGGNIAHFAHVRGALVGFLVILF